MTASTRKAAFAVVSGGLMIREAGAILDGFFFGGGRIGLIMFIYQSISLHHQTQLQSTQRTQTSTEA